jgi:hypothetical protein
VYQLPSLGQSKPPEGIGHILVASVNDLARSGSIYDCGCLATAEPAVGEHETIWAEFIAWIIDGGLHTSNNVETNASEARVGTQEFCCPASVQSGCIPQLTPACRMWACKVNETRLGVVRFDCGPMRVQMGWSDQDPRPSFD